MPNLSDPAVDAFTWGDIERMKRRAVVEARCAYCRELVAVDRGAKNRDCPRCGGSETVSSPLVKLGVV